jgi:S1-C subfamily serine protease
MSFPRIPDWLIYATAVAAITGVALLRRENAEAPPAPPAFDAEQGALIGPSTPFDPLTVVAAPAGPAEPTAGTAFVVSAAGKWMTARHVVDGCRKAAIVLGGGHALKADVTLFPSGDVALLSTEGAPTALPMAVGRPLYVGERAFTPGFPQGRPGELAARLLGRETLRVKGRFKGQGYGDVPVLAWAEVGRTDGAGGSLAGLSGAPMLDEQGRVVGVILGERPRRGRIYTTAPESMGPALKEMTPGPDLADGLPLTTDNYGRMADSLRRDLRVAQVMCLGG